MTNPNRDLGEPASTFAGWLALIISVLLASLIPGILGYKIFAWLPFDQSEIFGLIVGAWAGQYFGFSRIAHEFFVKTSQKMAFVATSPYTGLGLGKRDASSAIVFGEGTVRPCVPFLGREARGNVPLELVTIPIEFSIPGKDAELFVTGIYQYRVDPNQVAGYVGFSEQTIASGISPKVEGRLTKKLSGKTLDEAKSLREPINEELTIEFGGENQVEPTDFEKLYCIVSENIVMQRISVSASVQADRDAVAGAEQMMLAVAKMMALTPEELKGMIKSKAITQEQLQVLYRNYFIKTGKTTQTMQAFSLEAGNLGLPPAIVEAMVKWLNRKGG